MERAADIEYSSAQLLTVVDSIIDRYAELSYLVWCCGWIPSRSGLDFFYTFFLSCNIEDLPKTTAAFTDDTDHDLASDILVSRSMLSDLINEAAKLKDTPATREVPKERLSKLLVILQWNVRDGAKLVPMAEQVGSPAGCQPTAGVCTVTSPILTAGRLAVTQQSR